MDWSTELEQRRTSIVFILLLIAVAILAVSSLRDVFSLDSYWHLKTGQDWIEKGLSPFLDHYSITHYGQPITSQPVVFQVVLYGFVNAFGIATGFNLIVFVSSLLTLTLSMWWLKQIKASTLVICLFIPVLVALLQQRMMVRPELFSYALMILSLVFSEKARSGQKVFPLIFLTMVFWSNYHSAILGYVIFLGLFINLAMEQIRARSGFAEWAQLIGWGLLILLAGLLNPQMKHPLFGIFFASSEWVNQITEYRSSFRGNVTVVTLGLSALSLVTLVLLVRQRLIGYLIVCGIFTWSAFSMVRMVTPAGIVILCLFALATSQIDLKKFLNTAPNFRKTVFTVSAATLFAASLLVCVLRAQQLVNSNQYMLGNFPDQLVQYMKSTDKSGKIFNDYGIGGYLIYELGDESRVYIDGRTNILYPFEHFSRWQEALKSPELLRSEVEEHG
ncbi:MAG: hypothetical protein KJO60_03990, partial [Desulfofustis sp.]|nr:hypothetical protein [Desulfofustis sp.]